MCQHCYLNMVVNTFYIEIEFYENIICQHGGRCDSGNNGFHCICDDTGYSGSLCENG